MGAASTVRDYYEALRRGDPLPPYFAGPSSPPPDGDRAAAQGRDGDREGDGAAVVVKYGIGERLVGYAAVVAGLREQTRTTADWTVESTALRTTERPTHAWFSDEVYMTWTDLEAGRERAFDTRWSGTLERRGGEWLFVGMHVSRPHRIGEGGGAPDGSGTGARSGERAPDADGSGTAADDGAGRDDPASGGA
ncbi:MAG: nuclear transport factor 2 family protein [Haloferacaceae archaeon]